jgi:hypothetical protein
MSEISMLHDRKVIPRTAHFVVCLVVLVVMRSTSFAQELDGIPEHVIKVALNPRSSVIYSGVMRKQLMRMGDAAAVAITKVLTGERPQADIVDRILLAIEISFESPEAIVNQADRKPQTALFVLASLDRQPLSTEQRKRLVQLEKKLKTLVSDSDNNRLRNAQ